MMYYGLTIGGEEYKLRLNTESCVALEKSLGKNPVQIFVEFDEGKIPKFTDLVVILHSTLQAYHHGMTINKVYELIDKFIADGHTMFDLYPVFTEVFREAGFIGKEEAAEKN